MIKMNDDGSDDDDVESVGNPELSYLSGSFLRLMNFKVAKTWRVPRICCI
jgi:hypothetical protein